MERECKKDKKRQKNVSTVCSVEVLIASYVCLAERNLPLHRHRAPLRGQRSGARCRVGFCKPDSVRPCGLCGHFSRGVSRALPSGRVQLLPGDSFGRAGYPLPCLSCITRGFPCLRRCLRSGGLLPHLFTLTLAGGLFSVALSVRPALAPAVSPVVEDALPCDVRTFLYGVTHSGRPNPNGRGSIHEGEGK